MAGKATAEKWLRELTNLVTASGIEDAAVAWVKDWVARRPDLKLTVDTGGNLLITQKGRKKRSLVVAVAHMDHPAFVVTGIEDDLIGFEFRGGVNPEYFQGARVHIPRLGDDAIFKIASYDPETGTGTLARGRSKAEVRVGDIGVWVFARSKPVDGIHQAPACDDLAGVAASLAALDRARKREDLRHLAVLLTRAEEVGLIGALHAAIHETLPRDARAISVETSRELPEARLGDGAIIRVGDRSTIFDPELTNRISRAAAAKRVKHQRKLMAGGGCEATAFGGLGYRSAGLCVALRNWHNRGNLDEVEAGKARRAVPMLEEISLDDFHGLIELILLAAGCADDPDPLPERLRDLYESQKHILA
ncbi:MAG: hypothetical protein DIU67_006145 [Actinomycetes bacterium]|jgi:putative aminopeptidase FrvX